MTEIVETTGRRMTMALQEALDAVPKRQLTIQALSEGPEAEGPYGPLFRAIALELQLVGLREGDALQGMEGDLAVDSDLVPPLPPAVGRALDVRFLPDGTHYLVDRDSGEPE